MAATPLQLPDKADQITPQYLNELTAKLLEIACTSDSGHGKSVLPWQSVEKLTKLVATLLQKEPSLVTVQPDPGQVVFVVGDTHGQLPDVTKLIEVIDYPSKERFIVFNGDFVDRGCWGLENMVLYMCWKLAFPDNVILIRGNHETSYCTKHYGFKTELLAKYSPKNGNRLFKAFLKLFTHLPLAALVGDKTLVLHGGLPRAPPGRSREAGASVRLGTLQHIRDSSKGGEDPDDSEDPEVVVASDVLWSDPAPSNGFARNCTRGIGVRFGPDQTVAFCKQEGLSLIIRSHEGPDARAQRRADALEQGRPEDGMGDMLQGYSVDHDLEGCKVVTVFSAPDYPMFMPDEKRYNNKAAVVKLEGPDFATPMFLQFNAYAPRPKGTCHYDLDLPGSDDERVPDSEAKPTASDVSEGAAAGRQQEEVASTSAAAAKAKGKERSSNADASTRAAQENPDSKVVPLRSKDAAAAGSSVVAAPPSKADAATSPMADPAAAAAAEEDEPQAASVGKRKAKAAAHVSNGADSSGLRRSKRLRGHNSEDAA